MSNETVKLSAKNNVLDLDLISFVSHQLKTPLTTLKINIDLLRQQALPMQKNSLRMMDEELNHIVHLVSDVLDMRKAEGGKGLLLCRWCKWDKVIQNVQDQLSELLNHTNIQLKISSVEKEIESYIDYIYIEQVLVNLIKNAVEHSPQNSVVDLSWSLMDEDKLRVIVSDEGEGIATENLDNIFSAFGKGRRNGASRKALLVGKNKVSTFLKTGSGLGLAIVRQVILSHGGEISVTNRSSRGACFIFTLPKVRRISHAA